MNQDQTLPLGDLLQLIKTWAQDLGFDQIEVSPLAMSDHESYLRRWLEQGFHGEMGYMARHVDLRVEPARLHPGALSALSLTMPYLPAGGQDQIQSTLADPEAAYIARYALGRDYHRVIRGRLKSLSTQINQWLINHDHLTFTSRPITDSAPFLEKRFAETSGLGWIGKHTLHINQHRGSYHFLGELLTNLPFSASSKTSSNHCGSCQRCIDICPTNAIVGPYELDARRCIAYLTIEYKGIIPESLRDAIGNRVFGCDDCQLICPWNRHAHVHQIKDFEPRHELDRSTLLSLFAWTEADYLARTEGSPLRRVGFDGWQRNLAVALGNAPFDERIIQALELKRRQSSDLVAAHVDWALNNQRAKENI
ncbi:MAG: tRNA epoxyqueuosine(34) reductase QueG [Pseudomonadales bacterium]